MYEFECNEESPSVCNLNEKSPSSGTTILYPFQKADVEFISMMEGEMNMSIKVLLYQIECSLTCYFMGDALAQKFHKLITRDRHSQLVNTPPANYRVATTLN